jgi:hypothetical protein
LEGYVASDQHDLRALIGEFGGKVQCRFAEDEGEQKWQTSPEGLILHILPATARRVLAAGWAFRWANGVVITPTLVGLLRTGVMDQLTSGELPTLRAIGHSVIGADSSKNLGNLWGALHLLELQGWTRHLGRDGESRFYLTALGTAVVEVVEEHRSMFDALVNDITVLKRYHALCHNHLRDSEAMERFLGYVAFSNENWGLPVGVGSPVRRLATRQLVNCLDGLLMGTALVAMGMPVYQKQGNRMVPVGDSVFSRFRDSEEWKERATFAEGVNGAFVGAVLEWMARRGLAEVEEDRVRLTAQGVIQIRMTPPLVSLGVSYLPSYEFIDELLVGNPDPCGIDTDSHVDRVMNVYGSSGAGSGPAAEVINKKVIRRLFDELPLEHQPAGIADIGCGDGTALKRLADYVINHTVRGKNLAEFPLVLVGADYNDAPLERTRETLSGYEAIEGVRVLVVKADITKPDEYNGRVMASGITVIDRKTGRERPLQLDDLLHTFMFLVHNRRLRVINPEQAHRIIERALGSIERQRISEVLQTYFHRTLPENPNELQSTVIDCFAMSFSDAHGLVEGAVAAADLVEFLVRWKPYAKHGLMSLEGHSPAAYSDEEAVPDHDEAWIRSDKLPHPLNWGMHFQSRQFMMPFNEYMLALTLAGFEPFDGKVHGGIYPPSVPSIDQLSQHRFFSIGCYVDRTHLRGVI